MKNSKNVYLVALLLMSSWIKAQPLVLDDVAVHQEYHLLYHHAKLVDAGENNVSFQDLKKNWSALPTIALPHPNANVSFTNHYFWYVFSVANTTSSTQTYYLEVGRPITDQVILYRENELGEVSINKSGDGIPFSQRAYAHRKSVFKVYLPPQQTTKFYINLKSDGEVLDLGAKLNTPEQFIRDTYTEQLVFGLFYGILLLAGITYLFFFFAIKDKTFLFYSVYVLSIGLMQFALDGFFYQFFGPEAGLYSRKGVILFASLATLNFVLYSRSFLHITPDFRWLHRGYNILIWGVALLFAVIVLPLPIPSFSYAVVNVFALSALLIAMVAIGVKLTRKEPVDGYFTIGIGFLALGITVFILNNFSLLPGSFITANGSKLGTGAEVIFLSLSMSNLIRKLRSDKEIAQSIALRKSEDMNELKSYFMKNMSHELRTPLNAIMGITDVMLKEDLPNAVRSNFEIIKYSSHSLLSSVNDILDFNQIEKGEITLDKQEFNPNTLFKQIELNARKQAADKGLTFTFEVEELPKIVLGDEARLTQIVNNVLSNAVKFTNVGYVDVKVLVSARFDEKIELKITISDSGVGIPKDKMDSIYEAFTQESINNKRKFGGLGLGLSIAKKLVELYQGSIDMESKVGQGTKCTLVLPFVVMASTGQDVPEITPPQLAETNEPRPINILLVEDNTMNQLLMKLIMQKWEGVTFAIANHGGECLTLLQQDHYDVVLMDLQMPVMDGYEAATAIRAGEAGVGNISIPIIALTADITEGTEQRVKQIGMDKYMSKPVNQDALYKTIKELTTQTQSA